MTQWELSPGAVRRMFGKMPIEEDVIGCPLVVLSVELFAMAPMHDLEGTAVPNDSRPNVARRILPFLVAAALVSLALLFRGPILGPALGNDAPLSIFTLAVAIAAWYGGFRAGMLATLLSIILGTYLFIEHDSMIPHKLADRVRVVMFIGEGAMISWLFYEMRTARSRVEQQREKLTEEVKLRRAAEAELLAANKRKDQFVAAVAHELRNPLAPIHNALQIMQEAGSDPAMVERARGIMERQVDQMVRIVADLMDVGRVGQGKLELHNEQVDLRTVVQSAVEASTPLIQAAGHKLTVALPDEPIWLDADPARLIQVFSNLLTNATKYTTRGGHISLRAERQEKNVMVHVRDNGIGIPPEALPTIFEMFSQVEDGADRRQGGLGIGLALVRRLVRLHGGSVEAHSAGRGLGSEFVVRLPLAASAPPARRETVREAARG